MDPGLSGEKIILFEILVQYYVFWEEEHLYPTKHVDLQFGKI